MPMKISSSPRSFCFIFTTAWLIVVVSIFIYGASQRDHDNVEQFPITARSEPSIPCRQQFFNSDQCSFVHDHCTSIDNQGLAPYLQWYYCSAQKTRAGLIVALIIWLVIVFASMATAADKFLAVNLASLVHSLKISENLAGVTIFAFGNGSSDLFSTLAAMNGGNGSLAISELFGAAAFIVSIVLGTIAVIRPFRVDRKAFLGDVVCFLLAASVNLILISDGSLALWESFVIISVYIAFVAYVLIRDRSSSKDELTDSAKIEADLMIEIEHAAPEAIETTALLPESTQLMTPATRQNDRKPSDVSSKTLVVEQVVEGDSSFKGSSADDQSDSASVSDWASEYEHEADIPPLIKLCQILKSPRSFSWKDLLSTSIRAPALLLIGMTTITQPEIEHTTDQVAASPDEPLQRQGSIVRAPERHPKEFWLLCVQIFLGLQFLTWLIWSKIGTPSITALGIASPTIGGCSLLFLFACWNVLLHPGPQLHLFLSTTGFLTATAWTYILASEAVALIESLGVISNISDALLGATVFAIGNSSDDIFADISVAKRGHPILASAACLGGPMLNTLLGIGFGSLIQVVRGHYRPYVFNVSASLFVSAASLLTALSVILGYVLLRGGKLDKYLGYSLMSLWVGFTVVNVYVSTKG